MSALRICAAAALAALPLLTAAGAAAQPVPRAISDGEDAGPRAPAGRSDSLLDGVAFDLEVSADESQASVQVGGYISRNIADEEGFRQSNANWSLKLAVPVGGGDDVSASSTWDALRNGPKLTLDLGFFGFRSAAQNLFGPAFRPIMAAARRNCAEDAAESSDGTDEERRQATERCRNAAPDAAFARRHSGYSPAAVNRSLFSGMWRVGFEGSVGVNRFEYVDPATLGDLDETKVQFSAALFGALYPADALSAVVGRVEYQNGYEAAEARILCRAVVADPAADCVRGAPTPPENIERLNFSLEYRRLFDTGSRLGSLAISPRVTFDALSSEASVEFPVYFVPRRSWPVSPGISVSYSTEKDELDVGLFLRTIFAF